MITRKNLLDDAILLHDAPWIFHTIAHQLQPMVKLSFLLANSCLAPSPVNVATRGRSTLLPDQIAQADYRMHDSQCKALKNVLKRKGCLKPDMIST